MKRLHVWVTLPDGRRLRAGELAISDPDRSHGGRLSGAFRYTPEFLADAAAFALDPVHLPLEDTEFEAQRPEAGVHAIFEDALPDDWGRRVLIRRFNVPRSEQRVPTLLALLGSRSLGALSFSDRAEPTPPAPVVGGAAFEDLVEIAARFDAGLPLDDTQLEWLRLGSSSPGGARPKVLTVRHGRECIAKLPAVHDTFSVVRLEGATLNLAKRAGLSVPQVALERIGQRDVLLVERFDVCGTHGRAHMASLRTLLGLEGHYTASYTDIADVLRRWSDKMVDDLHQLYRAMVFNAAIGNTDDHLKNFSMLRDAAGWRLSPLYDLLPNWNGNMEHTLQFLEDAYPPTRSTLLRMASRFSLSATAAEVVINEVLAVAWHWRRVFEDFGVPVADCERLARDIQTRFDRL